jgi:hypothetical protein
MTPGGKRELLEATRPRYLRARKADKGRILDEFVLNTGYHRKYAIHLLRHGPPRRRTTRRTVRRVYGPLVRAALIRIWEVCDRICSRRLHPYLPEILAVLKRQGEWTLDPKAEGLLLQMSRATIDRLLHSARAQYPRRGLSTTKPGTLLKKAIPVRTFADWDDARPGFLELDLVAHCGETAAGEYFQTLDTVDVSTGWCECLALPQRNQRAVVAAMTELDQRLPFPLLGIDSDNDSAFLNDLLLRYCQTRKLVFTRSRPYKKNDQAHVEQKNWSVVRRASGYDRYDSALALERLQSVYRLLRLYTNFFQPVMKLQAKERVDSRVRKVYDEAQTPYHRVLASPHVSDQDKERLRQTYMTLNPVMLKRQLEAAQEALWQLAR